MILASAVYLTIIVTSIVAGFVLHATPLALDTAIGAGVASIIMFTLFFLVFVGFSLFKGVKPREFVSHYQIKKIALKDVFVVIVLAAVCIVGFVLLQNASIGLFTHLGYNPPEGFLINTWYEYLLLVFALAVMPGIVEELLFRGLIQRGFESLGAVTAMFMSAALFSLFHLSPAQTVYQFFFGLICAWVYFRTKNLSIPILLHFINNFLILTYTYISQNYGAFSFDATFFVSMVVLLGLGAVLIWRLVLLLPDAPKKQLTEKQPFWSATNAGFFVCVVVSMVIWVTVFVGSGGANGY